MSELAVKGGRKAVTIDQSEALKWPLFGEEEKKRVLEVMDMSTGAISGGCYAEAYQFEKEFAGWLGSKYALAHNNGTAAIHAGLFAVGVGPGDEVIVPSYTFWASCMPVFACNGLCVFAEVDTKTATIDPADVEKKINSRTRAIVVVHIWGMPCDMDRIMDIARRHNLKVIEDAAQAHGAEYRGKKVGTIGDVGCFSFQASKNLSAIEGGMLVTDNREYYERAVALGHYERIAALPEDSKYRKHAATCFGYKYRMHPLSAAIGRVQLRHLDGRNKKRNENIQYMNNRLRNLKGIEVFETPSHIKRIYYQYEIICHEEKLGISKEKFVQALQAEGVIAVNERYPLQHLQPLYREKDLYANGCPWKCHSVNRDVSPPESLPVTENLRDKIIALPAFPRAEKPLLDQYAEAFEKVIRNINELR